MANTSYYPNTTRPHWGGANSDVDIHLEIYKGEIDSLFPYKAAFLGWSAQRSTANQSNNYRIDRLNSSTVKGRQSGGSVDSQRVLNDKMNIIVDTTIYIRNPIDWNDDWTAPDFLREMGQNNATTYAEAFDEAHIIQLIKARSWTAPADLKPAFNDGIEVACTFKADAATTAELEANAVALEQAHAKVIQTLVERRTPMSNMVTIVTPKVYSALMNHPKLVNLDWGNVNYNGFIDRRMVRINGIPVVELPVFPRTAGTNPLGASFTTTADDIACEMIVFDKSLSLVTVTARPLVTDLWEDKKEMTRILDMYSMYTIGARRPDTVGVVKLVAPTP